MSSGYNAIQPYLDTIPAYTEEDVRQYVATHKFSGNITYLKEPRVESIDYVSNEVVHQKLETVNINGEEQVVFLAEMSGVFEFHGGPYPGIRDTFHKLFVVFDARTGNVLTVSYQH